MRHIQDKYRAYFIVFIVIYCDIEHILCFSLVSCCILRELKCFVFTDNIVSLFFILLCHIVST